jgi:hypothetical protein
MGNTLGFSSYKKHCYELSMPGNKVIKNRLNQNHFVPSSYLGFDIYLTELLAIFLSSSRQNPEQYAQLAHECCLPYIFQFITNVLSLRFDATCSEILTVLLISSEKNKVGWGE